MLRKIPSYVWTFAALLLGILLGGFFPEALNPVAVATRYFINFIIKIVPVLIFIALSPAIASLVKRGLAGNFAGSVVLWYVLSSMLAGLLGVVSSALIFHIPFSAKTTGSTSGVFEMFQSLGKHGTSIPLLSIAVAIVIGAIAVWITPLYKLLNKVQKSITNIGRSIGYIMVPLILCFGITIGVRFGARLGLGHYFTMVMYTFVLCLVWWLFYVYVIIKTLAKQPVKKVINEYFTPTALVAAGTCSSMATLPVNLAFAKKYGVRDEVADFVIPFGAVFNLNASALAYLAYAPFVMTYIYHFEISWTMLFMAWPALVLFTIAAPGLPAGMGTSLWAATLFASIMGLEDPTKATFIATWIALSGGLPDMFRTVINSTGDGFTAIVFDHFFNRYFNKNNNSCGK